jgi:hypothetical protein
MADQFPARFEMLLFLLLGMSDACEFSRGFRKLVSFHVWNFSVAQIDYPNLCQLLFLYSNKSGFVSSFFSLRVLSFFGVLIGTML